MSDALWLKVRFRDKEVFAQVTSDGGFATNPQGLVAFRYALGGKDYKSRPPNFEKIGDQSPVVGPTAGSTGSNSGRSGGRGRKVKALTLADRRLGHAVQLWTDGACSGNPGPSGAGVYYDDGDRSREVSVWLGEGTNNIAELTAILKGIELLESPDTPVDIITDSTYCIGLLSLGWKAKKNQALVAELKGAYDALSDARLIKVKGHSGVDGNERADELACRAVELRASQDSGWRQ